MVTSPTSPAVFARPYHRPRRLIIAVLLALAVVALATGGYVAAGQVLGGRHGGNALAKVQVFHWAADGFGSNDVVTLDPDQAADALSEQVTGLLFDRLVTLDAGMHVEDWAARSVAVSPDGMVYTLWLQPGQRFSDGSPVRASDYAYSLDRALNTCLQSPVSYFLLPLRDAQNFSNDACVNGQLTSTLTSPGPPRQTLIGDSILPDDGAGVLTLMLAQPAAYFLDALATGPTAALDRRVVFGPSLGQDGRWADSLACGATGQGGSGMFYLARWGHQGSVVFKANPYWWGSHDGKRPHLTEIDVRVFADPLQANLSYSAFTGASAYDYTDNLPGRQIAGLTPSDLHVRLLLQVTTIAFNWRIPPFDSLDARQAFCLAINRDTLVRDALPGAAIPSWHLMPQSMPGYNPRLTGIDGVSATSGDLAAARAHWAAYVASLHGQPMPTVYLSYDTSSATGFHLGATLLAQWSAAFPGVAVKKFLDDWSGGMPLAKLQSFMPAYRFVWLADYPDPQDVLSMPYMSSSPFNQQNAHLPGVDALLARADALYRPADQPLRLALYAQAEQELIQQVAICPIYQSEQLYRVRPYVHGCAPDALGMIPAGAWVSCFIARH